MSNLVEFKEITPFIHCMMILLLIVIVISVTLMGNRAKRFSYLKQFSIWFGISVLCLWIIYNIYYFTPANFKIDVSLPLHICDILAIIAAMALIKQNRKTSALLYFCGLLLAGQVVITPIGNQNPATFRFWLFWLLHAGIIAAVVYDLIVRRYQPVFKDFLFVIVCLIFYAAIILPVDIAFGWNYGYIGNSKPDTVTMIDALGAWPQRLIWTFLIVVAIQFIMYLPWKFLKNKKS